MFEGFDFDGFWNDHPEAIRGGQGPVLTDEMVLEAEKELGYKLPDSYIWLLKQRNGGFLKRTDFLLGYELPIVGDRTMMRQLYSIRMDNSFSSIIGAYGTKFLVEDWGYPDIGVAIGVGIFGEHEVFFLDYRECGPQGEPKVSHVDQECDYRITVLAENFEEYIRKLVEPVD